MYKKVRLYCTQLRIKNVTIVLLVFDVLLLLARLEKNESKFLRCARNKQMELT